MSGQVDFEAIDVFVSFLAENRLNVEREFFNYDGRRCLLAGALGRTNGRTGQSSSLATVRLVNRYIYVGESSSSYSRQGQRADWSGRMVEVQRAWARRSSLTSLEECVPLFFAPLDEKTLAAPIGGRARRR